MPKDPHPPSDTQSEVVAFLTGRSAPCPRCSYDLRDIQTARCPECAEPLVLTVGSPKTRFGWLILAMAPGCFSGVAALFVMIPIAMSIWHGVTLGQVVPWPIVGADIFGFSSAASVALMYRHRHRVMSWPVHRQRAFAIAVWGVHILAFTLVIVGLWFVA